jgi:hypothetical protein
MQAIVALFIRYLGAVCGHKNISRTRLGTAKLNDLNPSEWMKDTLEKLPTWPNELLPFAVASVDAKSLDGN